MEQILIDTDALSELVGEPIEVFLSRLDLKLPPPVDAVPVIRCRDCKHTYYSDNFGITAPWLMCKRHIGNCYRVNENDFCSWAERKDND